MPQVLVYGPPAQPCSEWQPVADLSAQLLEHLEQTGWRDLQPPPARQQQQRQQGEEGCLRLRGGGATKRKAAAAAGGQAKGGAAAAPIYRPDDVFEATVGQEVEVRLCGVAGGCTPVKLCEDCAMPRPASCCSWFIRSKGLPAVTCMPDPAARLACCCSSQLLITGLLLSPAPQVMSAEEGLYGCWFTGTIQRLAGGWALVAYDELREAEGDDSPPLREWFPIPGLRQQAGGPLAGAASGGPDGGAGHSVHGIWENHHLRPKPPPRVGCGMGHVGARHFMSDSVVVH